MSSAFVAQVSDQSSGFSIYCTSNLDSTGACNRIDNDQPIACVVIPGGMISCKEKSQQPIECVLYGVPLDLQAYFYCTRRTDPGMRDPIKQNRFTPGSARNKNNVDLPLEDPLPDIIDTPPPPTNPIRNPFRDVL